MAAGAADRRRQERLARRVDHVGDVFLDNVVDGSAVTVPALAHPQRHRADDRLVDPALGIHPRLDQVAGDLLHDEPVERQVGIEGPHEVVAVHPGVLGRHVPLVAVGVGVVDDVHPVAGLVLAVVGAGEKRLDEPFVC